jgi:hypothetical protein
MGKLSRNKGNRVERALVAALQDNGFAAERVPLSGAARGRFGGDVSVPSSASTAASRSRPAPMASRASTTGLTAPTCSSSRPTAKILWWSSRCAWPPKIAAIAERSRGRRENDR